MYTRFEEIPEDTMAQIVQSLRGVDEICRLIALNDSLYAIDHGDLNFDTFDENEIISERNCLYGVGHPGCVYLSEYYGNINGFGTPLGFLRIKRHLLTVRHFKDGDFTMDNPLHGQLGLMPLLYEGIHPDTRKPGPIQHEVGSLGPVWGVTKIPGVDIRPAALTLDGVSIRSDASVIPFQREKRICDYDLSIRLFTKIVQEHGFRRLENAAY
jgi:hypothetical protein